MVSTVPAKDHRHPARLRNRASWKGPSNEGGEGVASPRHREILPGLGSREENVSGRAVGLLSLNLSMRKDSEFGWHPGLFRQWGRGSGALTRSAAGDQTNTPLLGTRPHSRGRPIVLRESSLRCALCLPEIILSPSAGHRPDWSRLKLRSSKSRRVLVEVPLWVEIAFTCDQLAPTVKYRASEEFRLLSLAGLEEFCLGLKYTPGKPSLCPSLFITPRRP